MVSDLFHVVLSCFQGKKAPRDNPPNGHFFVFSRDDLPPRHAKERPFSCVAFSPPVCRIFAWRGERSPRENPPKSPFGVFLRGDLSPRQAKIRQSVGENATRGMSRTFVWRGERSPCENTKKSPFGGFSRGAFSPRKHAYTTWHKSATIHLWGRQFNDLMIDNQELGMHDLKDHSIKLADGCLVW